VTAATALSGVVAGTTIDTGLVKLPAWRRLGAEFWASLSALPGHSAASTWTKWCSGAIVA
jgi:hypothetical protein